MFPLLFSSNQATGGKENHTTIPTALQGFHFVFLIGLFPVANLNFSTSSFQFYSCLGIMEEVVCRTKFKISLFQELGGFWYASRSGMLSERGIIGSPSSVRNASAMQKKKRCSNLLALENAHSWSMLSPPSSPLGHVHCSLAHLLAAACTVSCCPPTQLDQTPHNEWFPLFHLLRKSQVLNIWTHIGNLTGALHAAVVFWKHLRRMPTTSSGPLVQAN